MSRMDNSGAEPLYRDSGIGYVLGKHVLTVAYGVGISGSLIAASWLLFVQRGASQQGNLLNALAALSLSLVFGLLLYVDVARNRPLAVYRERIEFPLRLRPASPSARTKPIRSLSADEIETCRLRVVDARESRKGAFFDWELVIMTKTGERFVLRPTRQAHTGKECVMALRRFCRMFELRQIVKARADWAESNHQMSTSTPPPV
jgi:hypothetical protein